MESLALLRDGSLPKLPLFERSSSVPMLPSWLRFDLGNPSFPRLSYGSALGGVSIGSTWNHNIRGKFLAHCGNAHTGNGETHSNAEENSLKALLSLVQPKESNSSTSVITSTKNEALKLVIEEKYDAALCHMKNLCSSAKAEVVYEARLARIEVLIRLDEYSQALEFLEKSNFPQSKAFEARLPLYKAVAYTMLGENGKAKTSWNTYLETLGNGNVNDKLQAHCRNTNSDKFLESAKGLLKPLLSLKSPIEEEGSLFWKIIPTKKKALKATLNGDYDAAQSYVEELCKDVKNNQHTALEAQIAYIQILIYLEKYKEALMHLIAIENIFPESDARPCLYMAIGLTALGNHKDAKICWKAFMKTIDLFSPFDG